MSDIPKRRFAFEPVDGYVDLYLESKKVLNRHRGSTGNYYFRIPEGVDVQFDVAEHDPQIPVEAEVTPDGLKPIERRPVFVRPTPDRDLDAEAEAKAKEKADLEAKLKAQEEAKNAEADRIQRAEEAAKIAAEARKKAEAAKQKSE